MEIYENNMEAIKKNLCCTQLKNIDCSRKGLQASLWPLPENTMKLNLEEWDLKKSVEH
jgi:hypothetical protein